MRGSQPGRRAIGSWGGALLAGALTALLMPAVAGAQTAEPGAPGVSVMLGATRGPDDVQTLTLNGRRIGSAGQTTQRFSLGELSPDDRIAIEATNTKAGFSWNFAITSLAGGRVTTLISELRTGGDASSSVPTRFGTVRRVVLNPSGTVLESCGQPNRTSCAPAVRLFGTAINNGNLYFQYNYKLQAPGFERFRLLRGNRLINSYSGRAPKSLFGQIYTVTLPLDARTREVVRAKGRGETVTFKLGIYMRDDEGKILRRSVRLQPKILG